MAGATYEIVVCPKCKGVGAREAYDPVDGNRGIYDFYEECRMCTGQGRVTKITEVRYEKITPKIIGRQK